MLLLEYFFLGADEFLRGMSGRNGDHIDQLKFTKEKCDGTHPETIQLGGSDHNTGTAFTAPIPDNSK